MRQNRFIATKDHFIMIAASNDVGDELWAGHVEFRKDDFSSATSNSIGFIVRGSANSFHNTSIDDENWQPYKSASSPLMLIRKNFTNFGLVSTMSDTLFGSILDKEDVISAQNKFILETNLTQDEKNVLGGNDSLDVARKCRVHQKRNIYTFEHVSDELDINIIPDSEIELEV